jgi:ABC-type hemin transport system substrate-binding protein
MLKNIFALIGFITTVGAVIELCQHAAKAKEKSDAELKAAADALAEAVAAAEAVFAKTAE